MRIDVYLTQNGYTTSRTRAQQLIADGKVCVDGATVQRPSQELDETWAHIVVLAQNDAYVGRGGCKLEAALDGFSILAENVWALDIGASTGGFTDCLLRRGAARVYAVDSGVGQLAPVLQQDSRVVSLERCNARYLQAEQLGEAFVARGGADLIVMDVSFISQTYILPRLPDLLLGDGRIVTLIKPQFEVGRQHIGKHGIVKESVQRRNAVLRVLECAATVGLVPLGVMRSPIEGGDGNVEYLACFRRVVDAEMQCITQMTATVVEGLSGELFQDKKKNK